MTRVSARYRSRWDGQIYTLGTNPLRRIQFGISALILLGGLVAAGFNGGFSGGSVLGMVLFGSIFFTSLWVAGFRRYFRIEPTTEKLTTGKSFFGVSLGPVETYSLASGIEAQIVTIPIHGSGSPRAVSAGPRSLTKLLLTTPEIQLFIDESSYPEEIQQLAREIETLQLRKI